MFVEGQEILEKRYKVIKRLGGGAFGEIYRGKSCHHDHHPRTFEVTHICY
jgi:hypothetical protein